MAIKAYVTNITNIGLNDGGVNFNCGFVDTSTNQGLGNLNDFIQFGTDITTFTVAELQTVIGTKVLAYAAGQSYSMSAADINWAIPNFFSAAEAAAIKAVAQPWSFNTAPGRSIVTGTGATGFQVSATRPSLVTYTPKITTTATIAGGQEGYVVLEVAPTNSATAGDWKEAGRVTNGQALSLAITLQSIQPVSATLMALVPAGYYVKVRSVNVTGTPAFSMVSGLEVLM